MGDFRSEFWGDHRSCSFFIFGPEVASCVYQGGGKNRTIVGTVSLVYLFHNLCKVIQALLRIDVTNTLGEVLGFLTTKDSRCGSINHRRIVIRLRLYVLLIICVM